MSEPKKHPLIGHVIGGVQIARLLREGSQAIAVSGVNKRLRRVCVLHILTREAAKDAELVERFNARAAALAKTGTASAKLQFFNLGQDRGLHYVELSRDSGADLDEI